MIIDDLNYLDPPSFSKKSLIQNTVYQIDIQCPEFDVKT